MSYEVWQNCWFFVLVRFFWPWQFTTAWLIVFYLASVRVTLRYNLLWECFSYIIHALYNSVWGWNLDCAWSWTFQHESGLLWSFSGLITIYYLLQLPMISLTNSALCWPTSPVYLFKQNLEYLTADSTAITAIRLNIFLLFTFQMVAFRLCQS